jgi:hypothetical protein
MRMLSAAYTIFFFTILLNIILMDFMLQTQGQ